MSNQNSPENISTAIDDRFYKLVDRTPVPCTLAEFAEAMKDDQNRIIEQTTVGELQVSTIFTGIDQNWESDSSAPIFLKQLFSAYRTISGRNGAFQVGMRPWKFIT